MSAVGKGTDRRSVLKVIGVAGAAATGAIAPGAEDAASAKGAPQPAGFPRATLATIVTSRGMGLGVRHPSGVIDVGAAEARLRLGLPGSVDDVIAGRGDLAALRRLIDTPSLHTSYLRDEKAVRFGPCVTAPQKIICVGLNYKSHIGEINVAFPTAPVLFNKFNNSLNQHGGSILVSDSPGTKFDYEAELVIVIGRSAKNVSEADALKHVFGYCTGQDFSARDRQFLTTQWMIGKCGDGWGPIGPWLVSADQVDPDALEVRCTVNGEQRQSSNTKLMIFDCAKIISFASQQMTLHPGDVIFTGTPSGVIIGYPPEKQKWLKAGDVIVTEIVPLGRQEIRLV